MRTGTMLTLLTRLGLNINTGAKPQVCEGALPNIRGAAEETVPRPLCERASEQQS